MLNVENRVPFVALWKNPLNNDEAFRVVRAAIRSKNVQVGVVEKKDIIWSVAHLYAPYLLAITGQANRLAELLLLLKNRNVSSITMQKILSSPLDNFDPFTKARGH